MWCYNCDQDVPGIASLHEGEEIVCCARCGEAVSSTNHPQTDNEAVDDHTPISARLAAASGGAYDMPSWDDWELDEKLYDVDRLLGEVGPPAAYPAASEAAHWPPQPDASSPSERLAALARKKAAAGRPRSRRRSSWLAWLVLGLGIMTFVCGSVLLGWSFFTDKAALWRVGMPLSLLGQAGLLIGLILQLEGLWQNDHDATETLDDLDEQINELRQAAAMLNSTHSRPGQSFYLHMAEGASPHLMLADLKSQLDLLAVQMEKQRR